MSNFSSTIPVALMDAANAALEVAGHGPGNYSVPTRTGTADATHAGFHAWNDPVFRQSVQDLIDSGDYPGLTITDGTGEPNFAAHCTTQALEWSPVEDWTQDPIMAGDQRTANGKTWESLIDYNVWPPGVSGWREVVSEGYPEWVQPTGAHDAYGIGDRVTFEGNDYESLIAANVWSPSAYPAGWVQL